MRKSRLWRVLAPMSLLALVIQTTTPAFSESTYQDEFLYAYESTAEDNRNALDNSDTSAPTACIILPRDESEEGLFQGSGHGNRGRMERQVHVHPADEARFVVECENRTTSQTFKVHVTVQYQYLAGVNQDWEGIGPRFDCPVVQSKQVTGQIQAATVSALGDCDPLVAFDSDQGRLHRAEIVVYVGDEIAEQNKNAEGYALPWTPVTPRCGDFGLGEPICATLSTVGLD